MGGEFFQGRLPSLLHKAKEQDQADTSKNSDK
jgi:hypothetical protein